jgi:hypothetical protein
VSWIYDVSYLHFVTPHLNGAALMNALKTKTTYE